MTIEQALTELKLLRIGDITKCSVETYIIAIDALQRRMPEKPIYRNGSHICSNCGYTCLNNQLSYKYCCRCGQAINWSNQSDKESERGRA